MPIKTKHADLRPFLCRAVLLALVVRLLALFLVIGSGAWSQGFMNPPTDDLRYESGARDYSETARSLWDQEAFTRVFDSYGDWVGHQLDRPFDVAPLWYLIACGLRYLTQSDLPLRVLNLIFSSLAVAYTGVFTQTVYGDKAARCASLCLALLPLPVFYSCFMFKELKWYRLVLLI